MNKIEQLNSMLKKIPRHVWILLAIVLLGTFLRAYRLNDWLDFGDDQVHDAALVKSVVTGENPWPLLGPDMSKSGNGAAEGSSRANRFHIGPIYYYFQIVSAKIFGMQPDKLAYPDFLFSVLSIPLFYYFLSLFFNRNLSLLLTFLYTISFYSLKFSHAAWNPNIIPFFVLLFIISLWKFLLLGKNVSWPWIVSLAVAFGVGIQLHAILLILLPAVIFFVFIYLLKKKQVGWKKWTSIIALVIFVNFGQVVSELNTNFANTKAFFMSVKGGDASSGEYLLINLVQDLECHAQANLHIASSLGDKKDCSLYVTNFINGSSVKNQIKKVKDPIVISGIVLATVFSVLGYSLMILRFRKERDQSKKYFLGLLILYAGLSFIVLLPVISTALRYFVHTIFIPFVFLGLIFEWFQDKWPKKSLQIIGLLFVITLFLNLSSIYYDAGEFAKRTRNSPQEKISYGETKLIVDFIVGKSFPQNEAYLLTSNKTNNFIRPLNYITDDQNFNLIARKPVDDIPAGKFIFYIIPHQDRQYSLRYGKITEFQNFGEVDVYKIEK